MTPRVPGVNFPAEIRMRPYKTITNPMMTKEYPKGKKSDVTRMAEKTCAINVDMDSLDNYLHIYGLPESMAVNVIYDVALPRFLTLFDELGIQATFFVVGKDLSSQGNREIIEDAAKRGHEIGNHTMNHRYELTTLHADAVFTEIASAHESISAIIGKAVKGFRAPGYIIDEFLLNALIDLGYLYDSSFFPSTVYHMAKLAAIFWMRLRGRKSHSIASLSQLHGPYKPFQWRLSRSDPSDGRDRRIWEIPIQVVPYLRLPFIGTSIILQGKTGFDYLWPLIRRENFLNIELHGIDLIDFHKDGIPGSLWRQPDLRVSLDRKLEIFRYVFQSIQREFTVRTLESFAVALE